MSLHLSLPEASPSQPRQRLQLDNKGALVKRLNDIVFSLSKDHGTTLDDGTIAAIHTKVDHIELLLNSEGKHPEPYEVQVLTDFQTPTTAGENILQSSPDLSEESRMSTKTASPSPSPPPRPAPSMTISRAVEIANAAEELASQLTASVEELQERREESEHIHRLLITRAEMAAERIVYLESKISEMEDDFESNQSELRFLRIQLKAIETQYSQSLQSEEDEELSQSIMNWKVDWEDIDRRSKARRMKRRALLANVQCPVMK